MTTILLPDEFENPSASGQTFDDLDHHRPVIPAELRQKLTDVLPLITAARAGSGQQISRVTAKISAN